MLGPTEVVVVGFNGFDMNDAAVTFDARGSCCFGAFIVVLFDKALPNTGVWSFFENNEVIFDCTGFSFINDCFCVVDIDPNEGGCALFKAMDEEPDVAVVPKTGVLGVGVADVEVV